MLIDLNIYKNKEDIPYKEKDIIHVREQVSGGVEDYVRVWEMNIIESENGYRVLIPSTTTFALPNYAMKMAISDLVVDVIDTLILTDLQKQEQTCINTLTTLRELRRNKELMRIVNETNCTNRSRC